MEPHVMTGYTQQFSFVDSFGEAFDVAIAQAEDQAVITTSDWQLASSPSVSLSLLQFIGHSAPSTDSYLQSALLTVMRYILTEYAASFEDTEDGSEGDELPF